MTTTENIAFLWNEITPLVRYIQMEYTNSKGIKAAYLVDIKANIYECIGLDKERLSELSFEDYLLEEARVALLKQLLYPKKTERESNGNPSVPSGVGKGLEEKNGKYYLSGLLESKEVLEGSEEDTRRPLTKAKDLIRERYMLSSKFRKFIVSPERIERGEVHGDVFYL
jgi:hypothetical protein